MNPDTPAYYIELLEGKALLINYGDGLYIDYVQAINKSSLYSRLFYLLFSKSLGVHIDTLGLEALVAGARVDLGVCTIMVVGELGKELYA